MYQYVKITVLSILVVACTTLGGAFAGREQWWGLPFSAAGGLFLALLILVALKEVR